MTHAHFSTPGVPSSRRTKKRRHREVGVFGCSVLWLTSPARNAACRISRRLQQRRGAPTDAGRAGRAGLCAVRLNSVASLCRACARVDVHANIVLLFTAHSIYRTRRHAQGLRVHCTTCAGSPRTRSVESVAPVICSFPFSVSFVFFFLNFALLQDMYAWRQISHFQCHSLIEGLSSLLAHWLLR